MTLQSKLDRMYVDLIKGVITKEEYGRLIEEIEKMNQAEIKVEFGFRKDGRTLSEFALHMVEQMEIEKSIIEHWKWSFGYLTFGIKADFEYSGISEDARLICESSSTKDKIKQPDVLITRMGTQEFLEIKQCPVLYKATYKTADLKHYHSLGNVNMLTAHTKGKFSADKVSFYTLLTPSNLSRLVADGKAGKLNVQKRREMGYKNAVQFARGDLENYFEIQEL
jgi:hypothetical protein